MSTNLSKQKRDDLTEKIRKIYKYIAKSPQDENTSNLLTWLSEIEKEIKTKKFGLVFEEHREAIDQKLETHIPVLTENKKLFIDNSGQINSLIEGDNLAALKLLLKTHKGRVDVIYIDPPYNRGGNDFIYDDKRIDSTDTFRHSKWLSSMKKRLNIARILLKSTGAIFISIDNIEQAPLRLLCDEIFSDNNFIGILIWRKKEGGGQTDSYFVTEHEYILAYSKSELFKWRDEEIPASEAQFNKEDKFGKFTAVKLAKWGNSARKEDRPTMYFSIRDPKGKKVYPIAPDGAAGRWRIGKKRMDELIEKKLILWLEKNNKFTPYEKIYYSDEKIKKIKERSILYDLTTTTDGTNELTRIFGIKDVFENPKPIELIKFFLRYSTGDKSIILDFYAGSGTTGHAVMKLNSEDNGTRHFILCTNNENNICRDVTYERIKRVIKKENYPASLKYYKIDFVPISDKLYYEYADQLLKHIRELVELENAINFTGNDKIAIILADDELDDFVKNIKKYKNCRKLYRAHNVLVSGKQAITLKNAKIKTIVIPDYYYGELEI